MKPILLILNGELRAPAAVRAAAKRAGAILCADGGSRHAIALGLQPQLVIGDMDSLPAKRPKWPGTMYFCDFDADLSDFEKSLRLIVRQRAPRVARRVLGAKPRAGGPVVFVAAASGGRLDQMLVNLALIERYSEELELVLIDDAPARLLGPGRHKIAGKKGGTLTLLPATPSARVTTAGLAYPLKKERLNRSSRGLSNRFTGASAAIAVHEGRVWAVG